MIYYDLDQRVEAWSTNIGDAVPEGVVTPQHQAHSTNVAMVPHEIDATYGVDALITNEMDVYIGVRTADCVPILLFDSEKMAIAAIHSGWKGTVNNIIEHAVNRMRDAYGTNSTAVKAVIGPCIHQEAFEVGDEVYEAFDAVGYGGYAKRMRNQYKAEGEIKWHVDLPGICASQLRKIGIDQIIQSELCTFANHDVLHSYRYTQCLDRELRIFTCIKMK